MRRGADHGARQTRPGRGQSEGKMIKVKLDKLSVAGEVTNFEVR